MTPLVNLISVHNLDPSRYHKVMDGCGVGSLYCSKKELNKIETDLTLIDQCRVLVNLPPPLSAVYISIREHIIPTLKPPQRSTMEPLLSLSHKFFQERIKGLSDRNIYF